MGLGRLVGWSAVPCALPCHHPCHSVRVSSLRGWDLVTGEPLVARPMPPEIGPAVAGRPRAAWLLRAGLLLARVVSRIDERDVGRSDAVHLDQRLLTARPREVPVGRRDRDEASDRQLLAGALIEFLTHGDEEHAGEPGYVLGGLVVVRRDLVVRRQLHAVDERSFLARITLHDRQLRARE